MALNQLQFPDEDWGRRAWTEATAHPPTRVVPDGGEFKRIDVAADVRSARYYALEGREGPAPVHTADDVFVGNRASPAERKEFATRKYFHGSDAPIPIGDYVIPGRDVGRDNYTMGRNESVFMTSNFKQAMDWGGMASFGEGPRFVHEVEPEGLNLRHARITHEFQADRAKVVKRWKVDRGFYADSPLKVRLDRNAASASTEQQEKLF